MDTDALRWFQEVADGVTVTEVSELTRTSQSGVSRALARLEAEVGAPLLRRSGRALRMTEAGAAFKRHVDALIHQLDDGLAAVQQVIDPESGTVSLAFESWLGREWVPSLVSSFRAQHPLVRFELIPGHADASPGLRQRDDVDLELTTLRPAPSSHGWLAIGRAPIRLAVPATHPLASRSEVAPAELLDLGFVAPRSGSPLRVVTDSLFAKSGPTPRIDFEFDDLATIHGFVAAGLGVAITPAPHRHRDAAEETDSNVRFLRVTGVATSLEVGISWSLHRRLLPAAETFLAQSRTLSGYGTAPVSQRSLL